MGWTFADRPDGLTDHDWFVANGSFTWPDDRRVIDSATVSERVFHAVLEMSAEQEPRLVPDADGRVCTALVFQIQRSSGARANFGWKPMDEFMGPMEAVCPEHIVAQLSPLQPDLLAAAHARGNAARAEGRPFYDPVLSAHEWRQRCRPAAAAPPDDVRSHRARNAA